MSTTVDVRWQNSEHQWKRFERDPGSGGSSTPQTLFGARCGPKIYPADGSETTHSMQTRVNASLSTTGVLGVERIFNEGGNIWLPVSSSALTVILSVDADPVNTASGSLDSNWNTLMASFTQPVFVTLVQEPDLGNKGMTAAQYKAALAHVHGLAASYPLAKTCGIFTSYQLNNSGQAFVETYIDPTMDYVGVDCYANNNLGNVNSLLKTYQLSVKLAADVGKPLIIPETSFGLGAGNGGQGYTDAAVTAMVNAGIPYLQNQGVALVSWFESNKSDGDWCIALSDGAGPSITTNGALTLFKNAVDSGVAAYTSSPWSF